MRTKKIILVFMITLLLVFSVGGTNNQQSKQKATNVRNNDASLDQPNGCGSGWNKDIVPDNPFNNNFEKACNNHDICYLTQGTTKEQCDINFARDLLLTCVKKTGLNKIICENTAVIYYEVVSTSDLAKSAYDDAQKNNLNSGPK